MSEDDGIERSKQAANAYWQWTLVISLGVLIAVTSFAAGMLAERDLFQDNSLADVGQAISSLGSDASSDTAGLSRLEEVQRLIEEEYYYRPTNSDDQAAFEQKLEYDAITGMTEGLEDEYTTFLVPIEQEPITEQMSGEYEGIGVWVDFPGGEFTIVAPMPGSPAQRAGLRAGDVIVTADGHPLKNVDENDAKDLVRGPTGTSVVLTIRRPGVEELLSISVPRERITMPAVIYSAVPDTKIAYIQVTVFGDKTTEQLDGALRQARDAGMEGIVLDLRDNGGGWVQSAQEMLGRFLPEGTGVALYEDTNPEDDDLQGEPIIGGGEEAFDLPMVVLVNGGTASAAEIVAGALRDYDRAVLVGEQSFGKGSVQRVHDFGDGSSARITFAQWLTPNKEVIQDKGVAPDIVVGRPDFAAPSDPQLERAVQELQAEG